MCEARGEGGEVLLRSDELGRCCRGDLKFRCGMLELRGALVCLLDCVILCLSLGQVGYLVRLRWEVGLEDDWREVIRDRLEKLPWLGGRASRWVCIHICSIRCRLGTVLRVMPPWHALWRQTVALALRDGGRAEELAFWP